MKWTHFASVVGALVVFDAGIAKAQEQPWVADRRIGEGQGYRLGELELHPGIAGEFGYDSNMFLRAEPERVVDVLRFRVTPSLSLATTKGDDGEGAERSVAFRAGVSASYNEYIAVDDTERETTSDFRNVGAAADFGLDIFPGRQWGAKLHGRLVRSIQPSNLADVTAAYDRINAEAGGELVWAPGGGLFDWRAGYTYGTTIFEEDRFENLNNYNHAIHTRGRWRFLPRTAFLFRAEQSFQRFSGRGARTYLLHSDPLRAELGFTGLITSHIGFLAMGGWGATFFQEGAVPIENYDGPIGQVQLTYYPTPGPGLADAPREATLALSSVGLGYTRNFSPASYWGGHYTRDRGYATVSYFFAQRVVLAIEAGISRVGYPTIYFPAGPGEPVTVRSGPFAETRYDSSLFTEYRIIETVGLNATLSYDANDSRLIRFDPVDPNTFDDLSWNRFQAFVGVRWFM